MVAHEVDLDNLTPEQAAVREAVLTRVGQLVAALDGEFISSCHEALNAVEQLHNEGEHAAEHAARMYGMAYNEASINLNVTWKIVLGEDKYDILRWRIAQEQGVDISKVTSIVTEDGVISWPDEEVQA